MSHIDCVLSLSTASRKMFALRCPSGLRLRLTLHLAIFQYFNLIEHDQRPASSHSDCTPPALSAVIEHFHGGVGLVETAHSSSHSYSLCNVSYPSPSHSLTTHNEYRLLRTLLPLSHCPFNSIFVPFLIPTQPTACLVLSYPRFLAPFLSLFEDV